MVNKTTIEERKQNHIRMCLTKDVQARSINAGFKDIHLVHKALPEINRNQVSTLTEIFGHKLAAPLIIGAMTGGTKTTTKINAVLAEAVEKLGLGMGVGSQRAALEDPKLAYTFQITREKAPTALLIANIGCPQLTSGYGVREAEEAVKMIKADALAIHLNPLQEAIQAEGQTDFMGGLNKIGEIAHALSVPIIAKETGGGIAAEVAVALDRAGVRGIDIGGAGGTSWAAVEYHRAKKVKDELRQRLGLTFWDWGIPTVASLIEVRNSTKLTIIATGGVRTGIDIVKALALGADAVGIALPLLKPALKGSEKVEKELNHLIAELKTAMFLTGAKSIQDLKKIPVVITGKTLDWLKVRGFKPEEYARRG